MVINKFQRDQVEKLKQSKEYEDASIYTILLELVEGNGADEVQNILHQVTVDLKDVQD